MNERGFLPIRPNVTPVAAPPISIRAVLLAVAVSVPWWVGAYQIVRWILR